MSQTILFLTRRNMRKLLQVLDVSLLRRNRNVIRTVLTEFTDSVERRPYIRRKLIPGDGTCYRSRTLRPQDTSASQKWCRSLRLISGGAVPHQNCSGSKCPDFSSITALVSKCLVARFWCRSVSECLDAEVSCGRSVR